VLGANVHIGVPGKQSARVLIVDDHKSFAELLSFALSAQPGIECVGTADNSVSGIELAARHQPDIVVLDIEMPDLDGLAAAREIHEVAPQAIITVVTAHRDPAWVARASQAGASAFVPKNGSLDEMLDVLLRVRRGGMLVAPSMYAATSVSAPAGAVAPPELTHREREVLGLLGSGMAAKAIARTLGISLNTCRGYVKAVLAKLGVNSQLEAVVKAQRLGLLEWCE